MVVFGDNSGRAVMGFEAFERMKIKLNDVLYVEGLKGNFISISQLCDTSYKVLYDCHEGKVFDSENQIVLTGLRSTTFIWFDFLCVDIATLFVFTLCFATFKFLNISY